MSSFFNKFAACTLLLCAVLVVSLCGSSALFAAPVPLNSVSGAATLSRTDLAVGRIYPIDVTRKYNSKSGYASPLGYGWALSLDKQLFTYSDNSVVIRTGPGQKKKYAASGSTFTSPAGDTGTLTYNSTDGTYTYTSVDGTQELFDSFGRLASITDPKGSSLALTYVSNSKTPLTGLLPANVDQANATVIANVYQLFKIEEKNSAGTATGNWISFSYEPATGLLASASDNRGRTITYGHDAIGNLTSVSGPGVAATYGYADPNNNHLLTTANEGSGLYTHSYDSQGRVVTQVHGNTTIAIAYTTPGQAGSVTTTVRDGNGNPISTESRTLEFDSNRQIVKETDTLGNQIRYTRDGNTWITRKEWWQNTGSVAVPTLVLDHAVDQTFDSKGNVLTKIEMDGATPASSNFAYTTTYTYDTSGNLLTETDPLSRTTTSTYNSKNQLLTVSGPQGTMSNSYDTSGNLLTTTDADNKTVTYTYDSRGNILTVVSATGKTTTNTYDANDNLATVTDPTGKVTSFTYDTSGNLLTQTDPGNKVTTYAYDTLNRPVTITDPLNHVTTYHYDASGNRDSITDANSNITRYTYTDKGQVATVEDPLHNITTYSYGGSGCPSCGGSGGSNLVALEDAKHQTTTFQYDFMNRLVTESDPLNKIVSYSYDKKGNLASKTDANQQTITYSYDALKRLTGIAYPGNSTVAYTYNSAGRVATAANGNVTYTYGYDQAGRINSVSDNRGYTITYTYDANGNRTAMILQPGAADQRTFSYGYDDAGRPATIGSTAGIFTYDYDQRGRRSTLAYPNQLTAVYAYDDAGRLTGINHQSSTATIASVTYPSIDNVGNRLSKTINNSQSEQYQYDAAYRLTAVTGANQESFAYDAVGNRTSGPGAKDTAYTHDASNRMAHGRKLGYSYDDNGNQISRADATTPSKDWQLTWDYENRLTKAEIIKGTERKTVTFSYDPQGRRIGKQLVTVIGGVTKTSNWTYVYDNDNIVMEFYTDPTTNNEKTFYTHGAGTDEHLALERNNNFYYYHADGLGSVTTITDASRAVVQSYTYDSFGMAKPSSGFRNSYTYTGREWDKEAGLYFYRARYYDPIEGRFISKDPIGFEGGDVNIYAYVGNGPINFKDSTGFSRFDPWYGYTDKDFKWWFHRCWKKKGGPRVTPEDEIAEGYAEWLSRGAPRNHKCWNKDQPKEDCKECKKQTKMVAVMLTTGYVVYKLIELFVCPPLVVVTP